MRHRTLILLVSLLTLLLVGCASSPATESPPDPTPTPVALAPSPTTAAVDSPPTPTPPPLPEPATPEGNSSLLPAPLYYLSFEGGSRQIWRVDREGNREQITREPEGIFQYDVSPRDGSLVYSSGLRLIRTDADGQSAQVLVDAPFVEAVADDILGPPLRGLAISPDGEEVIFGLDGIYRVAIAGGDPEAVIRDDSQRLYRPEGWTPSGEQMLGNIGFRGGEGGALMLIDRESGRVDELAGIPCCAPGAWSPSGSELYYANPYPGLLPAGIWRLTDDTAAFEMLISSDDVPTQDFQDIWQFASPKVGSDGNLYLFAGQAPGLDPETGQIELSLAMSRLPTDDIRPEALQTLREERYELGEALWAPDITGAALWAGENPWSEQGGELLWLPTDPTLPPVPLGATGRDLRWGP